MNDDLELRRKRALYRAQHRGTKEMDWLLGRYAQAYLPQMTGERLSEFETFLEVPDQHLQHWILDGGDVGEKKFAAMVQTLRDFNGL